MANNVNTALTDSGRSNISDVERQARRDLSEARADRKKYEEELERLRNDYATLTEFEKSVIYLIMVCKNTDYLVECIDDQFDVIDNLVDPNAIPFFKDLYDFSSFKETENNKITSSNDAYMEILQTKAAQTDELKGVISKKIVETIDNIQDAINRIISAEDRLYGYGNH